MIASTKQGVRDGVERVLDGSQRCLEMCGSVYGCSVKVTHDEVWVGGMYHCRVRFGCTVWGGDSSM